LEEDGFFILKFNERESGSAYATNEERGSYYGSESAHKFVLAPKERSWKWNDGSESDSGVDATDLEYECEFNADHSTFTLFYMLRKFVLKKA